MHDRAKQASGRIYLSDGVEIVTASVRESRAIEGSMLVQCKMSAFLQLAERKALSMVVDNVELTVSGISVGGSGASGENVSCKMPVEIDQLTRCVSMCKKPYIHNVLLLLPVPSENGVVSLGRWVSLIEDCQRQKPHLHKVARLPASVTCLPGTHPKYPNQIN